MAARRASVERAAASRHWFTNWRRFSGAVDVGGSGMMKFRMVASCRREESTRMSWTPLAQRSVPTMSCCWTPYAATCMPTAPRARRFGRGGGGLRAAMRRGLLWRRRGATIVRGVCTADKGGDALVGCGRTTPGSQDARGHRKVRATTVACTVVHQADKLGQEARGVMPARRVLGVCSVDTSRRSQGMARVPGDEKYPEVLGA